MAKIIIITKNANVFCRSRKTVTKNTGSNIKEQYSALQTEYLQNLSAMQNVITINLAITLGLVAAYVALLTNLKMQNYTYIKAIFIMLPIIGLHGAISCIRTLRVQNADSREKRKILNELERKLGFIEVKRPLYYKPIHITLFGFAFFCVLFGFALMMGIANLDLWGNCNVSFKYVISALLTVGGSAGMVWISNSIYKIKTKYFDR